MGLIGKRNSGEYLGAGFYEHSTNGSGFRDAKKKVVPGFEPELVGSKPTVITTTLYNHFKF